MQETLYRKYRPASFSQVVGQQHVTDTLKSQLINNGTSQAYIFIGPRGCGKTTVARILAKSINCLNLKDGEACNDCENCKLFDSNQSLDVLEIDAASNRSIEDIKDLKEKVNFSPVKFKKKIYIIDEVHMLSKDAFNALLKTLEEPPSFVVYILATTDVQKVPPTILSRCQRFDFKLAKENDLQNVLSNIVKAENKLMNKEVIDLISTLANGSFRDSQSILQKLISQANSEVEMHIDEASTILGLTNSSEVKKMLEALYNKKFGTLIDIFRELSANGIAADRIVIQLIRLTQSLIYSNSANYSIDQLYSVLGLLIELESKIKISNFPDILFESGIYKYCQVSTAQLEVNNQPTNVSFTSHSETGNKAVDNKSNENKINASKAEEISAETKSGLELTPQNTDLPKAKASIEDLRTNWLEVVKALKTANPNLSSFLAQAKLDSINEKDELVLLVKYKFHQKKIIEHKSKILIIAELKKLQFSISDVVSHLGSQGAELDSKRKSDIVGDVFSDIMN